jgi:hypothetical protein
LPFGGQLGHRTPPDVRRQITRHGLPNEAFVILRRKLKARFGIHIPGSSRWNERRDTAHIHLANGALSGPRIHRGRRGGAIGPSGSEET